VRTVLGIRHHGPGSARSLVGALEELRPDCVLIEGPADASELLAFVADTGTQPPVALLAYAAADPSRSVFYPFARFSPEWQAAAWALAHEVPVSFIDLPAAELLAEEEPEQRDEVAADPLAALARAAGYEDPERWWEDMVEHRDGDLDTFAAVRDAMAALREELPLDTPREQRREAHMRHRIAAAERDGLERVAVVCGAWHAPVLAADGRAPKPPTVRGAKTVVTWVPWTYDRLSRRSGYGAGVTSPGWYEHLFDTAEQPLVTWLARVAQSLRAHDSDISTAHVIEAARSAQGLAALRGRPLPGLPEITDALGMVLGDGADSVLALLREELIIGQRLGRVSERVPTVPLQRDLEATANTLRLKLDPAQRDAELDLRKESDLRRSHLLHRLRLLGIPWGEPGRVSGARGTFREAWRLQWQPEFAVAVIEASGWGPTVPLAATARVRARALESDHLAELTALLEAGLLADLPSAVGSVLVAFEASAAVSSDIPALMEGLPALARAARYGTVRQTDTGAVMEVLSELLTRIAVGLPAAAAAIDDEAAGELVQQVAAVDGALSTLADDALNAEWRASLARTMDRADAHPLITGRACRILRDADRLAGEQVAQHMDRALSRATEPLHAAAWLEGFLTGSGLALIHDRTLLALVDRWLSRASQDGFTTVLPVLRRTFSTFAAAERRQIGERVRGGAALVAPPSTARELDAERAELVIPVLAQLLEVSR
jgi:Family of unknown function (DUF5682)